MEYQIGGWVRLLRDYCNAKKGDILQITEVISQSHVNVNFNGKSLGSGLLTTNSLLNTECEWVGMEKPQENEVILKVGDWVKIADKELPIIENWLGETNGTFTHQGPYQIEEINSSNTCVLRMGGKSCTLSFTRFTKVEPQEIKNSPEEAKTEKWQPKMGDWVWANCPNAGPKKEVVGVVHIIDSSYITQPCIKIKGNQTWFYPEKAEDLIRKARPEEIPHTEGVRVSPTEEESIEKTSEITKEEVLRRYPKGTRYRGLRDGNTQTSEGVITHFTGYNAAVGYDYVYRNGKWADIVEEEQEDLLEEAKRRFPIGTRFGNLHDYIGDECIVIGGHYISGKDILVKADRPFEKVKDGGTYIYKRGQWAKSPTKYYEGSNTPLTSFSSTIIDMGTPGELRTKWNIPSNNGVEKMPGEIIVKRNKKVGRRLIMV